VTGVGRLVTVSETTSSQRIDYGYDRRSGVLAWFRRTDSASPHHRTCTELQLTGTI